MGRLSESSREKIHTRNVRVNTCACKGKGILVEGELVEKRLKPYYNVSGNKQPPHTIHHMIIRMRVEGPDFTIADIEGEMIAAPHADQCRATLKSLDKIKGFTISPGFTGRVKKSIGGVAGCVHLTTLLLAMAPAAIQGAWVNIADKPVEKAVSSDLMQQYLIDTCQVWRKQGPLAQNLLARRAAANKGRTAVDDQAAI